MSFGSRKLGSVTPQFLSELRYTLQLQGGDETSHEAMLHAIAHVLDTVDAYCKLYFLVDGDTSVQSILTYADWDIDDLKTAIMNKAHLGHFKTFDIILRRVKIAFFWPFFSPVFVATRSH